MKKYLLLSLICGVAIILVSTFYAKGALPPEPTSPVPALQPSLREPAQIMSVEEKSYHIERSLKVDNRPAFKEPVKVKGIYMSGRVINHPRLFQNLVNLVDETELNSLVIDIKDDEGFLTTDLNIPLAKEIKARVHRGMNLLENITYLNERDIYPIARLVVFKDPSLAEGRPDLAIKKSDGTIWRDRKGLAWVDPYNQTVWQYAVDIAKEAAKLGFREIQFDYVRFPTDGNKIGRAHV